jgi:chromate transport protein ChrA
MSCPNSDPNFDKVLSNFTDVNRPDYPEYRMMLFYGVCILVRLALYSLVYIYRKEKWMQMAVIVFSMVSIAQLHQSVWTPGRQWWSKRFQLTMSVLVVVAASLVLAGKIDPIYMPALLFTSLAGGFTQSLFVKFC